MVRIDINEYEEDLEEGIIYLAPREVFDKGIVGFTEDCKHIVYDIDLLIDALAESYTDSETPVDDAIDWIDMNTIEGILNMDSEYRPILMTDGGF